MHLDRRHRTRRGLRLPLPLPRRTMQSSCPCPAAPGVAHLQHAVKGGAQRRVSVGGEAPKQDAQRLARGWGGGSSSKSGSALGVLQDKRRTTLPADKPCRAAAAAQAMSRCRRCSSCCSLGYLYPAAAFATYTPASVTPAAGCGTQPLPAGRPASPPGTAASAASTPQAAPPGRVALAAGPVAAGRVTTPGRQHPGSIRASDWQGL